MFTPLDFYSTFAIFQHYHKRVKVLEYSPAGITCCKLTIEKLERGVNFEHI